MPAEEAMPCLEEPSFEEPHVEEPQVEEPQVEDPKPVLISELLVGFSQLEMYHVVPWICFEAQNMCEPP